MIGRSRPGDPADAVRGAIGDRSVAEGARAPLGRRLEQEPSDLGPVDL